MMDQTNGADHNAPLDEYEGIGRSESSPTIAKIASALAKAQSKIEAASKDKTNPHFGSRYADLASVWEACRAPLSDNGLSIVQLPSSDGPRVTVTTLLLHDSGEWIRSSLTLTARGQGPQDVGSAMTYARRYGLAAMVGVVADEDDDGNAASREAAPNNRRQSNRPPARNDAPANNVPAAARAEPPSSAAPPPGATSETDEQKIARWTSALKAARTLAELKAVGKRISEDRQLSDAVRLKLTATYSELQEAFKSKKQPGPCTLCGDKEHGSSVCPNSTPEERAEALRVAATAGAA